LFYKNSLLYFHFISSQDNFEQELSIPTSISLQIRDQIPWSFIIRFGISSSNSIELVKATLEALKICHEKVQKHNLEMKLIDAEYTFDNNKVLFYFTADGRVDFRELVKDLATVFRTRIELRQIGVRDESKTIGSIGVCGRSLCCSQFLGEFEPVSIKMAKEQGLSLNPTKISGACGRLMCCLKYEQDVYEELLKITPKQGSVVQTPIGKGVVEYVNILKGLVKVKIDDEREKAVQEFRVDEIKILKRSTQDKNAEKIDEEMLKSLE